MTTKERPHTPASGAYFSSPAREDIYVLLSALLRQSPTDHLMRQLADLCWDKGMSPALAASLERLRTAAGDCSAEAVEREFADLFIGMGRGEVMPYASWYAEKLLMGAPLVRLRGDLAKMQISRRTQVCEPEDHAAALCEAMVVMIRSPEISPAQQTAFFHRHMHTWMMRLFRDLQQAQSARFYRAVGSLGEHFLRVEKQHLQANKARRVKT
jgi:TorA maturation chaperone TorD